jgi:hypothetical protein
MSKAVISAICITILFACTAVLAAEQPSSIVVFSEAGFPTADSASPSPEQLEKILPAARLVSEEQLGTLLDTPTTRLLVLPYGSAFPEKAWPEIYRFLHRGGNLLVLGGRPFTRSAYRDTAGWKLRDYSVRFTRPLMIERTGLCFLYCYIRSLGNLRA